MVSRASILLLWGAASALACGGRTTIDAGTTGGTGAVTSAGGRATTGGLSSIGGRANTGGLVNAGGRGAGGNALGGSGPTMGSGGSGNQGCVYEGMWFPHGAAFLAADGCNRCSCSNGTVGLCTDTDCPPTDCFFNGLGYSANQKFPAGDGCHACTCHLGGQVSCSDGPCEECLYKGELHPAGAMFPSRDGCNTCYCEPGGFVTCSTTPCACQPANEWWRSYALGDRCPDRGFTCPGLTHHFQNACGCGCEQDPDCPEFIFCKADDMSCSIGSDLFERCPFSERFFQ